MIPRLAQQGELSVSIGGKVKRKISVLIASLFVVGALQSAAPAQAAEPARVATACADPNCPWSPVTMFVKDTAWWVLWNVDNTCHRVLDNCPL